MPAHPFHHRIVRDLAWVIASPPLISGIKNKVNWLDHQKCTEEYKACLNTLIELDANPAPLIAHINALKSKRLGYRFESFISYWLQISPNFDLLAQNIQVIENKRTLGEIDFIIREKHSLKIIHLEVAVKFYLGTTPFEDAFRWFGTNTQDQLGRKQQHLTDHQTQLSLNYPEHLKFKINERHCLLKGRLFYPFGANTPPLGTTENHLRGRWARQSDLLKHQQENKLKLFSIEKSDWLATLSSKDFEQKHQLEEHNTISKAQCTVQGTLEESGEAQESLRIFILPNTFEFPDKLAINQ